MSASSGIDDEPVLVRVVAGDLKRDGFDVVTMADGFEAPELARRTQPDVVVLDVMTHRICWIEVCRELQTLGDAHTTKPFSSRVLVTRIRTLLRRRRTPAKPAESARQRRFGDLMIDPEPCEV